jgi:PST family polysaccharide transporter
MTSEPHPLLAAPSSAMKSRAVRGAMATTSSQAIKIVVQFVSVVSLARLLTPRDFGVFAMVTPIIGFSTMFQDFGLSQALVTSPNLSQEQAAGMFRMNMALSSVIALFLAILAPAVGYFYGEPIVVWITIAMAAQIVVAGATVSHTALLSRGMKFHKLALIDIAKTIGGFGAAIGVALIYPSPWALASQTIGAAFIGLILAWTMTGWRPVGRTSFESLKPMLRFGAGMTTFNLSNYLSRNADNVMIGWAHGAVQLGLYDRAYKLLLYPLQQINSPIANVMIPILSRIADEPARYRAAYKRTLRQTLLVTTPGMAFLICAAPVLITTLMGERWAPAIPIFQWLGIAGLHQTISNTFGWLFVSQRRTTEYAKFGLFSTATCLAAFAAGLPWGAAGVAAAYAISGVVIRLPVIVLTVGKRGPVSANDIISLFWPYALAISIAMGTWFFGIAMLPIDGVPYLIVSAIYIYAVSWAVLLCMRQGREAFADAIGLLPEKLRRKVPFIRTRA